MLPEGYSVPEGRVKPFGTGHAILCAAKAVDGPFAVINADDYYGPKAFRVLYDYLTSHEDDDKYRFIMVGFYIENTITENGHVARGICEVDKDHNLTEIAERYPGPIRVGGHSKGGNLAMYAATTAEEAVRERLEAVFNFDGPGLSDCMDAATLYARVAGRLRSFVPQGSIVGMLLAHPDAYAIVKSKSISIFQHDPYSWQVEGPGFVRMPELSGDSRRFEAGFRQWLAAQDEVSRAELVDTLFDVLRATDAQNFGREFWLGLAQNGRAVRKAIKDVGPEKAARVWKMITDLGKLSL